MGKKSSGTDESWERARSDKQKKLRINEILTAAALLEAEYKYDDITIVAIAKEASFTRSNLYKYFETKEEIFLELIKFDLTVWFDDIAGEMQKKKKLSPKQFSSLWATVLVRHQRLVRLLPLLNSTLEPNVSLEKLVSFKQTFFHISSQIVPIIMRVLNGISHKKALEFFTMQGVFAMGLHLNTCQTEKQLKAVDLAGGAHTPIDFKKYMARVTLFIVEGLLNSNT